MNTKETLAAAQQIDNRDIEVEEKRTTEERDPEVKQ